MTNVDLVSAAITRHPGATDGELRQFSGVEPHQQVNQICRRLAQQKRTIRRIRRDGRIGNYPYSDAVPDAAAPVSAPPTELAEIHRAQTFAGSGARRGRPLTVPLPRRALIVLPCSSAKRDGGTDCSDSRFVTERLSSPVGRCLIAARTANAGRAKVDEHCLMPAHVRYNGQLYAAGRQAIDRAIDDDLDVIIISGGYGLLDAREPIGQYNRAFRPADWPSRLLESALLELASPLGAVIAFCSRTTKYSDLLRRVNWRSRELTCHLVSPDAGGRGGAQRIVPRASGQALLAHLHGGLHTDWVSTDGLTVTVEVLE
jgi:hypothetical protein